MKKIVVLAMIPVLASTLPAPLFAGKEESGATAAASAPSSHGGGSGAAGGASSAPAVHSGGSGGGSAPAAHSGGGGFGGGGTPAHYAPEPGRFGRGNGPSHPGGFDGRHEFDGNHGNELRYRQRSDYDRYPDVFAPIADSQGGPFPFRRAPRTEPSVIFPAPSLPNPSAAELAALAHDKPILGPRWVSASAHPRWDKTLEHVWRGHHYRWYSNGWLMVDDSFWPPDTYSYRQALFITSGVDSLVADVQSKLRQLCYYHGTIDGDEGPSTRAAVERYQRYKGLPATGTINKPLLQLLGLG